MNAPLIKLDAPRLRAHPNPATQDSLRGAHAPSRVAIGALADGIHFAGECAVGDGANRCPRPRALSPETADEAAVSRNSRRPLSNLLTFESGLISVQAAKTALRCGEKQIMSWIGSGELEWAFDLRARNDTRSYTRILTQSVVKLQQPRAPLRLRRRDWRSWVAAPPSFEEVFDSIFKHHRPWIRTSELMLAWNCCSGHIRNLIDLHVLEIENRAYLPNEAKLVSRQSAAAFMRARRLP